MDIDEMKRTLHKAAEDLHEAADSVVYDLEEKAESGALSDEERGLLDEARQLRGFMETCR